MCCVRVEVKHEGCASRTVGLQLYQPCLCHMIAVQWEEALRSQSGTYTEAGFSAAKRAADCRQMSMATARQNGVWKAAAVKTAASLVRGGAGGGTGAQLYS